jgi:hypothetical protein
MFRLRVRIDRFPYFLFLYHFLKLCFVYYNIDHYYELSIIIMIDIIYCRFIQESVTHTWHPSVNP